MWRKREYKGTGRGLSGIGRVIVDVQDTIKGAERVIVEVQGTIKSHFLYISMQRDTCIVKRRCKGTHACMVKRRLTRLSFHS